MTDLRTLAAFATAVLIGGANYIAVTFSNMEMAPLFGATVRFALATLLFLVLIQMAGLPLARGRAAAGAFVYGVLGFGIAYACVYYALLGLTAGTTSVVLATVPLFTLVIAALLGQERFTTRGVFGGVLALTGIAVLSLGTLGGEVVSGRHLLAALASALAAAASSVVAKSLPAVHPLNMNAIGMAAGTVLLATGSLLLRESWTLPGDLRTWTALAWLATLGSVGLFQLFLYVMGRWKASATVYALAGMPVVATVLGAVLLGQRITLSAIVGTSLVIAAVYAGAIAAQKSASEA